MGLNFEIALKYLFGKDFFKNFFRKKDGNLSFSSFFPVFAITLSVYVLIVIISISNGFKVEMIKRILGFNGHICVYNNGHAVNEDIITEISKESYVKSVYPVVKQQVIVSSKEASGAILHGVTVEDITNRPLIKDSISQEVIERFEQEDDGIIIGSKLAEFLNIKIGDSVMVLCPQEKKLNLSNMMPKIKYMKFIGTFDVGMNDYNSSFVFVKLSAAKSMFGLGKNVNEIDIFVDDPNNSSKYIEKISSIVSEFDENYISSDWESINENFLSAIKMQKIVMMIVFCLVILIATFSSIACIITMVQRKNKEIAILKTIGFSNFEVMKIFLICGQIIGIIGVILGVALGLLVASNVTPIVSFIENILGLKMAVGMYGLESIPCVIDYYEVTSICVVAYLMTFISAIYPAFKASRIDPTSVLRYEG
jgi:lipoprotein-releasing system permease protein